MSTSIIPSVEDSVVKYYDSIAQYYDYIVPYSERQDVKFFVEKANESKGPVLEIGCGTGRVLIPIARAGVKITGLDSSLAMLAVCREKLLREPKPVQAQVQLITGDMRNFDLGREFGLVTMPFRPFQHMLTIADQLSCLHNIHRHLRAGGKLIMDSFYPSLPDLVNQHALGKLHQEPEFAMPDGRKIVRHYRVVARDLFNQIDDYEMIYHVKHPNGREDRLVHNLRIRYFFKFEVEHLLARSGFETETIYSDYDHDPFGSRYSGELLVVARKP